MSVAVVGLHVDEYKNLGARRREVDDWLARIGRQGDRWFNFWLLDESGLNLRVQRYKRDANGNMHFDKGRREVAVEEIDVLVPERPPVLMVRR